MLSRWTVQSKLSALRVSARLRSGTRRRRPLLANKLWLVEVLSERTSQSGHPISRTAKHFSDLGMRIVRQQEQKSHDSLCACAAAME